MASEILPREEDGVTRPLTGARPERRPAIPVLATCLAGHAAVGGAEARAMCGPMALLLGQKMRFDAADPLWPDRDRLVLAPDLTGLGIAAAALLGAGDGLFDMPVQALGTALGMAVAERMLAARFGRSLVDHRCWVLGDGAALPSGAVQESAILAGARRLARLTMIARVAAADAPGLAGFAAAGWNVRRAAIADMDAVAGEMAAALRSPRPTLIVCVDGSAGVLARTAAGCTTDPAPDCPEFEATAWAACGARGTGARRAWLKRVARHAGRQGFEQALSGRLVPGWQAPLAGPGLVARPDGDGRSTAETVRQACAALVAVLPTLGSPVVEAGWAVQDGTVGVARPTPGLAQAEAACMAGMAVHGGIVPVAVHCLDDVERIRPALADASRAGVRAIQILVEPALACRVAGRRAGLRAMRNLVVFRPSDSAEALECLELAVRRTVGPSVLLLSDDAAPPLPDHAGRNRVARGGHVVAEFDADRDVTLIASGPELRVALAARAALADMGVAAAVVALPCWTLFAAQDLQWQARVLGMAPRIGMEAGSGFGWDRWLGETGLFISLLPWPDDRRSPASAPDARQVAAAVVGHLGHLGPPAA